MINAGRKIYRSRKISGCEKNKEVLWWIRVGKYQGAKIYRSRKISGCKKNKEVWWWIRVGKYIEVGKYQGARKIKRYDDKWG